MNSSSKKKYKRREPIWKLNDKQKGLLINQVESFVKDFVPPPNKIKLKKDASIDDLIRFHLNQALTIMAILNSARGMDSSD